MLSLRNAIKNVHCNHTAEMVFQSFSLLRNVIFLAKKPVSSNFIFWSSRFLPFLETTYNLHKPVHYLEIEKLDDGKHNLSISCS